MKTERDENMKVKGHLRRVKDIYGMEKKKRREEDECVCVCVALSPKSLPPQPVDYTNSQNIDMTPNIL